MASARRKRDPIPDHFASAEEAAAFWDAHDLSDYWDQTREARFQVDIQSHQFLAALEPELAQKLLRRARQRGISTETLINVWLTEKLESGA
ncbi:MAG: CopG family antitoxin [Candidatus Sumerlaeota bacterium]|nr:CopG family antitoxin [Candidatus Sumerlaeota bacterium]